MALKGPIEDWDALYRDTAVEQMPWYHAQLDPDVAAALEDLDLRAGSALDLGTGPGTQALALARRGFAVTGTDISPAAVAQAQARAQGAPVDFRVDDILATRLPLGFTLVLDRGCFHVLDPQRRPAYVAAVHRLLRPEGRLLLKTFSVRETGERGPHRFSPEEIEAIFAPRFAVESIRESVFHGTLERFPIALFGVLRPLRGEGA